MDIVQNLQRLLPWAADLPFVPKVVLSILILGVAALLLSLIWTPQATGGSSDQVGLLRRAQANLDGTNPAERKLAVETLGQSSDPLARDALKKALGHPLRDVRVYAAVFLAKQEPAASIPILVEGLSYDRFDETNRYLQRGSEQALAALGSTSVPALLTALDSSDTTTWINAAETLGLIGDSLPVDKLLRLLAQKLPKDYPDPRESIIEALGQIGDRRAAPELVAIVASGRENEFTKREAVWSIGKIGDRDIVPSLLEASKRSDRKTLALVAYVLGILGDDRAIPMLAALLKDKAPADDGLIHLGTQPMSQIASEALRKIGSEAALKVLNKGR